MEIKKTLYWFTAFVPLIISCFALLFLPQYIPSHFNFVGVIDAWSVKYNSFIISGSGLLLAMFFYLCAYAFERKITTSSDIKENINNQKILLGVGFAFDLLFVAGTIAFYAVAFKVTERTRMNATSLIGVIIGTLSIIFGLVVRLLGEKAIFVIRKKRNASNATARKKISLRAGVCFVCCGAATAVASCIVSGYYPLIPIICGTIFAVIYSIILFFFHKKLQHNLSK
jgi:hypothetical protein